MKTININGKEYTENEFNNQVDSEDIFFEGFHNCEDAEDLKQFIFQGLRDEFPRQQPEPPTLRPMSELPEAGYIKAAFLVSHPEWQEAQEWKIGFSQILIGKKCRFVSIGDMELHFQNKNYTCLDGVQLIGWLPLPNPNEIKLPC